MRILENTLQKMSNIGEPQRKFLIVLMTTLMLNRGKANYRNLSRYSEIGEKSYSRWFRREFDFVEFNRLAMQEHMPSENIKVAAMDCRFVTKSGKHTYGIDNFYNGKHSKAEKGLEISTLAVVDVTYNTAYNLSTRQTPVLENSFETRVDWYLEHFRRDCRSLPLSVNHLVTDGYDSKQKFTHGIVKLGYHQIGKLRKDANVRYLYQGKQKPGAGRNKQYDGKVDFNDVSRFQQIKIDEQLSIYTEVVNNITLKCNIRMAYLVKKTGSKLSTALLFSTDINLSALKIYEYYKSRFQIEFLFRDVKE